MQGQWRWTSALPAGPGASFEMSYVYVKDGEGPCFRSLK